MITGAYHTERARVGMWYFSNYSRGNDLSGNGNHALMSGVTFAPGPKGEPNGAVEFNETRASYIEIPNNGKLDVMRSYTLMLQVTITTPLTFIKHICTCIQ